MLVFDLLPTGFSNRDLGKNLAALLGEDPAQFTQGRMTYQLRRFRVHRSSNGFPRPATTD